MTKPSGVSPLCPGCIKVLRRRQRLRRLSKVLSTRGTSRFLSRAGSPFTLQQQQQPPKGLCLCLYHISLRLHRASDAASRSPHFRNPQNAQPSPTLGCAMLISACVIHFSYGVEDSPRFLSSRQKRHFFILSSPMRYGVDRPRP